MGSRPSSPLGDRKPTLIISDVEMPVMGGYEMCRAQAGPALRDIPVILLTSLSEASDVLRGLEVGRGLLPDQAIRSGPAPGPGRIDPGQ